MFVTQIIGFGLMHMMMIIAIQLNRQAQRRTIEVQDVLVHTKLTLEKQTRKLTFLQSLPKSTLSGSSVCTQLASQANTFMQIFALPAYGLAPKLSPSVRPL